MQVVIEETVIALPGNREFDIYFSKGENIDRVGRWHLVFSRRTEGRPLLYGIGLAAADGRTDSQLWKPEPTVATGDLVQDAQALLWLAGQYARRYMQRLDGEFAAAAPEVKFEDDLETRIPLNPLAGVGRDPTLRPPVPASPEATATAGQEDGV